MRVENFVFRFKIFFGVGNFTLFDFNYFLERGIRYLILIIFWRGVCGAYDIFSD